MKREIIIAITLGLLGGLVITVGMYRARTAVETALPEATFEAVATAQPEETPTALTAAADLRVSEPTDELLSRTAEIRVTGQTDPDIPVVILSQDKELITRSDIEGNFSTTVALEAGSNIFHIRALRRNLPSSEIIRTVVYSTSEFTEIPTTQETPSPRR